jgi:hypothetical protein
MLLLLHVQLLQATQQLLYCGALLWVLVPAGSHDLSVAWGPVGRHCGVPVLVGDCKEATAQKQMSQQFQPSVPTTVPPCSSTNHSCNTCCTEHACASQCCNCKHRYLQALLSRGPPFLQLGSPIAYFQPAKAPSCLSYCCVKPSITSARKGSQPLTHVEDLADGQPLLRV